MESRAFHRALARKLIREGQHRRRGPRMRRSDLQLATLELRRGDEMRRQAPQTAARAAMQGREVKPA